MRCAAGLVAVGTCLVTLPIIAAPQSIPRQGLVDLDAVVMDRDGQTVRGLKREDFQVKEDGRAVALTSFSEVSAAGLDGPSDGRSIVLLLDDKDVPLNATTIMQRIGRLFLSFARRDDLTAVVRLTHREDEAFGTVDSALDRLSEYHTGSPFMFGRDMRDDLLQTVARVARQLEPDTHRRKALVCIGGQDTCDPYFETPQYSLLWDAWRDAIAATARANAVVYMVSPAGVNARMDFGQGLVEQTGGDYFGRSNDFARTARMIWDEVSHYYLLGYTPTSHPRQLHAIDVTVRRKGLRVLARQSRGDSARESR